MHHHGKGGKTQPNIQHIQLGCCCCRAAQSCHHRKPKNGEDNPQILRGFRCHFRGNTMQQYGS
ncbi:hypothetical protein AA15669_0528 [Saccharibacter floricola DSM 15669]|uniref:Uncharacterized protein n=1 Tax=Saccharibacter floricola DSM 15669 TaxID=1123227 RepID=A0ABQ0NX49_9PROT|nr:hypothetical protein AA15669_0528 [Saccharibacter floricola DSM 15669]